jgi:hypothetical protein
MLRRAGVLVALSALLVPTVAGTATADAAKRKKRSPVVTKITPSEAFVGDTLTIRGRYFRRGVNKNTVAFKRRGEKVVFVKAEKGTLKLLKVTLPKRLEKVLAVQNGTPVVTRLQVRVLSARFGKRFTKLSRSPRIGPEKPPAPPTPPPAAPDGDCDGDGQINGVDTDDDNDLLADDYETALKLDPCKADSDGDGVEDGYELASARDLNDDEHQEPNTFLPYPAKRPYPNPLDGTDLDTDHDGDSLTLEEEYDLWKFTGVRTLDRLTYSAGEQYSASSRAGGSGRRTPTLSATNYHRQAEFLAWAGAAGYASVKLADVGTVFDSPSATWWADRGAAYDIRDFDRSRGALNPDEIEYLDDGDGFLHDAERDEDADGLSNWAETRGCMAPKYWDDLYDKETPYPLQYAGTNHADPDTDGDGVRDGADDQDNDDVPNVMECSRLAAHGPGAVNATIGLRPARAMVNPYNPCLPHQRSRTCRQYVTIGSPWAPYNPDDEYFHIKN